VIFAIMDDGTSVVAAMDGRFVIFAITDDGTNSAAAMDGRFVIFAIRDDCMNTALKWYYFNAAASNSLKAAETALRLHYRLATPGNPACKVTAPMRVWHLLDET
jgi:hypothetical protein